MSTSLQKVQPAVRVDGERVVTNSRDVARVFDKRHDDVLRATDNLLTQLAVVAPVALRSFAESSYLAGNGKLERCFDMDRDGFTLLAMGFTGQEALKFKVDYVAAFNAMEAALASPVLGNAESRAIIELLTGHLRDLEKPAIVAPEGFTALGFAISRGLPHTKREVKALGSRAAQISRETGAAIGHVHDSRYGHIGSYAEPILVQAAKDLHLVA